MDLSVVALLVLLTAAAGTGIVAADLWYRQGGKDILEIVVVEEIVFNKVVIENQVSDGPVGRRERDGETFFFKGLADLVERVSLESGPMMGQKSQKRGPA